MSAENQSVFGINVISEYKDATPYGIKPDQIWISQNSHFSDLRVVGIQKRSKEQLVFCEDLSTGQHRSISAYNLVKTGNYRLKHN